VLTVPTATSAIEAAIASFLRRAPYLHIYELGDLDPREAGHTTWIANQVENGPIDAVALLYRGLSSPVLVALADDDPAALAALVAANAHALPPRFHAHLTPGIEAALAPRYRLEFLGHNLKMGLASPVADRVADGAADGPNDAIVRLGAEDAGEAVAFYAASYPTSYFQPVNLERGPYLAIRDGHGIAAIAGVHVYSPALRVAALGNIATRPDVRGRGYARRLAAALCRRLQAEVDVIGLNVRADNAAAIACYRAVGFDVRHASDEWLVTAI
jgi:ribosomal protein S18 acetylase RimI-like enzyme